MLLKQQTISQQYHLEHHHSFCNRQSTLQTKGLFSNILSGKLQKQMCVPSMALFNTNSIFYCYYAMLCKLYSVVNCQMKKKKIRNLCCCGIHLYLFDTHKFICLTLKSIFFFCLAGKTAEYSDLLIAPNLLASASPKNFNLSYNHLFYANQKKKFLVQEVRSSCRHQKL